MEFNVGALIETPVFPLTDPDIAVMMVDAPTPLGGLKTAAPSPVAVTLTIVEEPELQVAVLVRFCVEPSVNVPVAVNCSNVPGAIVEFAGVTAIEASVAAVTCNVVAPLILPDAAVIVVLPAVLLLAKPALEMVATPTVDELQVAVLVKSFVEPSVYVPIAANCFVSPAATDGLVGVTVMRLRVGVLGVLLDELHETSRLSIASAMRRGSALTMASLPAKDWDGGRLGTCPRVY